MSIFEEYGVFKEEADNKNEYVYLKNKRKSEWTINQSV